MSVIIKGMKMPEVTLNKHKKIDIYKLIDYYIDECVKEKEHQTSRFARAGMLQGLIWICRFGGITDDDLGDERFAKIESIVRLEN